VSESAPALAARKAALDLLQAALARRGGLEEALGKGRFAALTGPDRAFARALVMATLRRLGQIDAVLAPLLRKAPPEGVRDLLRLGLAQVWQLETPAFAAVDTTVSLAPRAFKPLVNAVLRKALAGAAPAEGDLAPPWLLARWRAAYGPERAARIAAELLREPATDLTPRGELDPASLEAKVLPGGTLRIERRGDITVWPGFAEGLWWVQDAAAAIPARLLRLQSGETALDACAAPGGKTLQMAAAGAAVTALDRDAGRLQRVKENLTRMGLTAETQAADAAAWKGQYDAVLLDAPCSATGTFRRHPDVLWNVRPGDIPSLAKSQQRLLDAAAACVKPGGRLVYSVCSLEAEEGEIQAQAFLKRHPDFQLDPIAPGEGGAPEASRMPKGWLRILPCDLEGGLDGFFIARFVRDRSAPS
jgi:16S rRNA (cytosine967-C5)-methyltransferase